MKSEGCKINFIRIKRSCTRNKLCINSCVVNKNNFSQRLIMLITKNYLKYNVKCATQVEAYRVMQSLTQP